MCQKILRVYRPVAYVSSGVHGRNQLIYVHVDTESVHTYVYTGTLSDTIITRHPVFWGTEADEGPFHLLWLSEPGGGSAPTGSHCSTGRS